MILLKYLKLIDTDLKIILLDHRNNTRTSCSKLFAALLIMLEIPP